MSHSRRGAQGFPFSETTAWSLHPLYLIELVVPGFFGSALKGPTLRTVVLSCRNMPYFPSFFLGFVPLFFALAGWALGRDRRRVFAAGTSIVLLVFSFGRFTPVFWLAYKLLPPLAVVRFPVKLLIPAMLFVALLAGGGFDALRQADNRTWQRRVRLLLPLKVLLGAVVLVWALSFVAPKSIAVPAEWILLRTSEMYAPNASVQLTAAQVAGSVDYLLKMLRLHLPGLAGFALGGWVWTLALERGKSWAPRALPAVVLLGLVQLATENYSANPTVPRSFYTYPPPVLAHFQDSQTPNRFSYVFRETETTPASPDIQSFLSFELIPEAAGLSPLAQAAFRDRLVLARGTMLEKVEGVSNIDVEWSFPPFLSELWTFAARGTSDPARSSCLVGRTNVRYQILRVRQPNTALREVATIFNGSSEPSYLYENLCVAPRTHVAGSVFHSTSATETLSRLSSPDFDPNWHATVDGEEVPILRANHLFRAVRAETGRHEVRFYYRQRGLRAGLVISVATLALLGALYAIELRRERKPTIKTPRP